MVVGGNFKMFQTNCDNKKNGKQCILATLKDLNERLKERMNFLVRSWNFTIMFGY